MEREFSAGVIVYTIKDNVRLYLLLHYKSGHWDLAKGHIEEGETKEEAALRELFEETKLTADIHPGFEESFEYMFRSPDSKDLVKKTVYFFVGEAHGTEVTLSEEHVGAEWLPLGQALKKLTFTNAQELLRHADFFLDEIL